MFFKHPFKFAYLIVMATNKGTEKIDNKASDNKLNEKNNSRVYKC